MLFFQIFNKNNFQSNVRLILTKNLIYIYNMTNSQDFEKYNSFDIILKENTFGKKVLYNEGKFCLK